MMKEWLQEKTTVEYAEQEHLVNDDRLGPNPVPFGFQQDTWLSFKKEIKQGDQIWKFRSSAESWRHFAGREGLCIVRDDEVVASIITRMN